MTGEPEERTIDRFPPVSPTEFTGVRRAWWRWWMPRVEPLAPPPPNVFLAAPEYPDGRGVVAHVTSDVPITAIEGTAFDALKAELREQARNGLLREIDEWLIDQAEADDVDGAEYDADLCRKIARDLAEHFTP